jgi:hypothetical protein
MPLKLKLDADGKPVLDGDKVVYYDDADTTKEFPLDAGHLYGRVRDLTKENETHRTSRTDAEKKLEAFAGIEDPAAALKALETVKSLGDGELIAAGKVDEIRAAARKAADEQVADATRALQTQVNEFKTTAEKATNELYAERIGGAFDRSKYIADKVAVPTDMVKAMFGSHFKSEDGKTVAYDAMGNKIYSRARPGELATFEESIEELVSAYPNRDAILKGKVLEGGGAKNPDGSPKVSGDKTMARSVFERLSPEERSTKMRAGFQLTDG